MRFTFSSRPCVLFHYVTIEHSFGIETISFGFYVFLVGEIMPLAPYHIVFMERHFVVHQSMGSVSANFSNS